MTTIPFQVPSKYAARVASGALKRIGTNIVDPNTGWIVSHVQEAGRLSANLSGGFNPFVQAGQLASSLTANVQLEQVKNMLGTLQLMTGATLAVSAIGLGVSVAGFVVMSRRLDALGARIGQMEEVLKDVRGDLYEIDLRQRARDRAAITSAMALGEEAWKRGDQADVWRELAQMLSLEENYYRALLEIDRPQGQSIVNDSAVQWIDVVASHEALSQLVAARIKCLLLLNELEAAHHYAEAWRDWLRQNFRDVTPPTLVDRRLRSQPQPTGGDSDLLRLELLPRAEEFIGIVRVQQEFADSMPYLIRTLESREIDGRDFIDRLRSESDQDLLVLDAQP